MAKVPITFPDVRIIGSDQQERKSNCNAVSLYFAHKGSVLMSWAITVSFLAMAAPQEPSSGPILRPFSFLQYSSGSLGATKTSKELSSFNKNNDVYASSCISSN